MVKNKLRGRGCKKTARPSIERQLKAALCVIASLRSQIEIVMGQTIEAAEKRKADLERRACDTCQYHGAKGRYGTGCYYPLLGGKDNPGFVVRDDEQRRLQTDGTAPCHAWAEWKEPLRGYIFHYCEWRDECPGEQFNRFHIECQSKGLAIVGPWERWKESDSGGVLFRRPVKLLSGDEQYMAWEAERIRISQLPTYSPGLRTYPIPHPSKWTALEKEMYRRSWFPGAGKRIDGHFVELGPDGYMLPFGPGLMSRMG